MWILGCNCSTIFFSCFDCTKEDVSHFASFRKIISHFSATNERLKHSMANGSVINFICKPCAYLLSKFSNRLYRTKVSDRFATNHKNAYLKMYNSIALNKSFTAYLVG